MSKRVGGMAVGMAMLLSACAGGGGGSADTPRRPAVSVPDEAPVVSRQQLVGTWHCHELNPLPQLPAQTVTTTYAAAGTFLSEGRSEPRPPFGAMQVKVRGTWSVQGNQIITKDVKTEGVSSDDAWTNMMANVGAQIVNGMGSQQLQGAGKILKLTRNEFVMQGVGVEDPPIVSCTR